MTMNTSNVTTMTLEQKRALYRDGYVILRSVVPRELVEAAVKRIDDSTEGEIISKDKSMTDLVNKSPMTPIMREAMGMFDPPIACQVGVRKVSEPEERVLTW